MLKISLGGRDGGSSHNESEHARRKERKKEKERDGNRESRKEEDAWFSPVHSFYSHEYVCSFIDEFLCVRRVKHGSMMMTIKDIFVRILFSLLYSIESREALINVYIQHIKRERGIEEHYLLLVFAFSPKIAFNKNSAGEKLIKFTMANESSSVEHTGDQWIQPASTPCQLLKWIGGYLCFTFLSGVVLNGIVICILLQKQRGRTPIDIYIIALCVADLAAALLGIPLPLTSNLACR